MKLFTYYTKAKSDLATQFFIPSVGIDYDLSVDILKEKCRTGHYMDKGWTQIMKEKNHKILEHIKDLKFDRFVYADSDIIFIRPTADIIHDLLNQYDIVFQSDRGTCCCGFMGIRSNKRTHDLIKLVISHIDKFKQGDQVVMNYLLGSGRVKDIKYKVLNHQHFFNIGGIYGGVNGGIYEGESLDFKVPDSIKMFHANFTKGKENKIKLLNYVKSKTWDMR